MNFRWYSNRIYTDLVVETMKLSHKIHTEYNGSQKHEYFF